MFFGVTAPSFSTRSRFGPLFQVLWLCSFDWLVVIYRYRRCVGVTIAQMVNCYESCVDLIWLIIIVEFVC